MMSMAQKSSALRSIGREPVVPDFWRGIRGSEKLLKDALVEGSIYERVVVNGQGKIQVRAVVRVNQSNFSFYPFRVRLADEAGRGLKHQFAGKHWDGFAVRLADEAGRGLKQDRARFQTITAKFASLMKRGVD